MLCAAITLGKNPHPCSQGITSGCTVEEDGYVHYLCRNHFTTNQRRIEKGQTPLTFDESRRTKMVSKEDTMNEQQELDLDDRVQNSRLAQLFTNPPEAGVYPPEETEEEATPELWEMTPNQLHQRWVQDGKHTCDLSYKGLVHVLRVRYVGDLVPFDARQLPANLIAWCVNHKVNPRWMKVLDFSYAYGVTRKGNLVALKDEIFPEQFTTIRREPADELRQRVLQGAGVRGGLNVWSLGLDKPSIYSVLF